MIRAALVVAALVAAAGCAHPSRVSAEQVTQEGSTTSTVYTGDGFALVAPEGVTPTHGVVDSGGADLLGNQPIAQVGYAGDRLFLQSPSDVSGEDWEITLNADGSRSFSFGTISISKSDPIAARDAQVASIQDRLASTDAEVQESIRAQAEAFADTIQAIAPELAGLIRTAFGAP